jgi:predicted TIM-barrel fold metal-dependent hydrolase
MPRRATPPGACDCHAHVFGPHAEFPLSPNREFTPPECLLPRYLRMLGALGVERAVIVHPSVYGTDNRASLAAIAAMGDRARGVAIIAPGISDADLERLHEGGMRGVRMSSVVRGGATPDMMESLAPRIAALGWHLVLHVRKADELPGLTSRAAKLEVPVVFDHLGGATSQDGVDSPGFRALLAHLERNDQAWVKISSFYRRSSEPKPWRDMAPLARALIETRPDRVLWGSNWPHPHYDGPMPDDADLLDVLLDWAPDEAARRAMLVDNPAKLYGFPNSQEADHG